MSIQGWFGANKAVEDAREESLDETEERNNLEEAMHAANHIFDDNLEAAEEQLRNGNSCFHILGRGLVSFIKATLGFEQDAIKEASTLLADAEASSHWISRKALAGHGFVSTIYEPGSEYALCCAEAQLMQAVVGVLTESLTESLKGFYKLRKGYQTLDTILRAEQRYGQQQIPQTLFSSVRRPDVREEPSIKYAPSPKPEDASEDSDSEVFEDAKEHFDGSQPVKKFESPTVLNVSPRSISPHLSSTPLEYQQDQQNEMLRSRRGKNEPSPTVSNHEFENISDRMSHPVDAFTHSGVCMCFGSLLLILSIIPPAFGRLLSLIGFQGDRERGLRLLWEAAKYNNVNGATAALMLLGYYNTFVNFCDILPDPSMSKGYEDDISAPYPTKRLENLLEKMRQKYPNSGLWTVESARMYAQKRQLSKGIQLLSQDNFRSPFKQVVALAGFEKSMQTLFAQEYSLCGSSFEKCCELNNWSHALYLYVAGCTHVQLYRDRPSNETKLYEHAQMAGDLFTRAKGVSGKRKMFARQLPLEVFVSRKLEKWKARADAHGLSLIDSIGVSPCDEVIYIFGGFKKMDDRQNNRSMKNLDESERLLNSHVWGNEAVDEWAALALLRATALRSRGKYQEAMMLLENKVLATNSGTFRGKLSDEWVGPAVHYELAANLWATRKSATEEGASLHNAKLVRTAKVHLDKAARWGNYDIEARMGMRITTGQHTIKSWLNEHEATASTRSTYLVS